MYRQTKEYLREYIKKRSSVGNPRICHALCSQGHKLQTGENFTDPFASPLSLLLLPPPHPAYAGHHAEAGQRIKSVLLTVSQGRKPIAFYGRVHLFPAETPQEALPEEREMRAVWGAGWVGNGALYWGILVGGLPSAPALLTEPHCPHCPQTSWWGCIAAW